MRKMQREEIHGHLLQIKSIYIDSANVRLHECIRNRITNLRISLLRLIRRIKRCTKVMVDKLNEIF